MAKMESHVEIVPLSRDPDSNKALLEKMLAHWTGEGWTPRGAFSVGQFSYTMFTKKKRQADEP